MRQKMRAVFEGSRAVFEGSHGRYLSELVNWSPAIMSFVIFLVNQNLLFLTYAMAFAMWQQFKLLRRL